MGLTTLYHGTSTRHLPDILSHGLRPRCETKNSNWDETVKSNPKYVYLTNCYAVHFASVAAAQTESEAVVLAVQVQEEDLFPDEDFLSSVFYDSEEDLTKLSLFEITELIDVTHYKEYALESIRGLGTCAIESVHPTSIVSHKLVPKEIQLACDPCIGIQAHTICGLYYERLTQVLFEGGVMPLMQECIVESLMGRKKSAEKS